MPLGGLGLAGINQASKKPTKQCERCGLRYPEEEKICTHCGNLNESELLALKERIENERKAHRYLGKKFITAALVIFIILLISYLQ